MSLHTETCRHRQLRELEDTEGETEAKGTGVCHHSIHWSVPEETADMVPDDACTSNSFELQMVP